MRKIVLFFLAVSVVAVLTTSNKKRSPRVRIVVLEGYAVSYPRGTPFYFTLPTLMRYYVP